MSDEQRLVQLVGERTELEILLTRRAMRPTPQLRRRMREMDIEIAALLERVRPQQEARDE